MADIFCKELNLSPAEFIEYISVKRLSDAQVADLFRQQAVEKSYQVGEYWLALAAYDLNLVRVVKGIVGNNH